MMRAVIVEDEDNSRELLRGAIEHFTEEVEIIGEASDVESGVALINDLKPDVLFLDIELPDGKGFDIIDKVEDGQYRVIFVTAYDDYTIKAIRYSAIDYLVKPLDIDDLEAAVGRLKKRPKMTRENVSFLTKQIKTKSNDGKIMVSNRNGYEMIEFDEILSIEASSNYVFFNLENGNKYLAAHSLNYYEDLLPDDRFFRIHKSFIVNFGKVKSIDSGRTGNVVLVDGTKLNVAARRKSVFISFLKKYNFF